MLHRDMGEIGGGYVRRRFATGGRTKLSGEKLTAAEIERIPRNNRNALIENGFIVVYPKGDGVAGAERHIVSRGFGKFDVVEGRKLNAAPLTKEEAKALAQTAAA